MKTRNSIITLIYTCLSMVLSASSSEVFFEGTFTSAKQRAKMENKILILDFTAKWCLPCRFMEKEVFNNQEVSSFLEKNAIVYKVDVEDFDGIVIKELYQISLLPTNIILDPNGNELTRKESSFGPQEYMKWISLQMELFQIKPAAKSQDKKTTQAAPEKTVVEISIPATDKELTSAEPNSDTEVGDNYYIQTGAFSQLSNAEKIAAQLKQRLDHDTQIFEEIQHGKILYKIALGSFETKEEAELFLDILRKEKVHGIVKKLF